MNKWLELIVGVVLLVAPVWVALTYLSTWGEAALSFIEGGLVVGVALVGLMFIMLGISDITA